MNNARKQSSDQDSIADSRDSSRTFGCVGVSSVAHLAFLAALTIFPQTMLNMSGENAGGRDGGAVSLIDSASDSPQSKMEAASVDIVSAQSLAADVSAAAAPAEIATEPEVMTDSSSDIVVKPRPKVESKIIPPVAAPAPAPVPAPVAKAPAPKPVPKAKPVVAKKTVTPVKTAAAAPVTEATPEEAVETEPAPVLLANPPSDDQPTPVENAVAEEKSEPVEEAKPEPVKPVVVAKQEPKQEPKEEPAKAIAVAPAPAKAEMRPEQRQSNASTGASAATANDSSNEGTEAGEKSSSSQASEKSSESSSGGGGTGMSRGASDSANGEEGSGDSKGSVAGPIRDASELKALPGNPNPVYPARDRLAKKEGTSVILGRVGPDGRVSEVTVERSSGSGNMDSASAQAFRSWRFQPGQQGWVRKPFQFRLVGEAKEVPAPLGKALKR